MAEPRLPASAQARLESEYDNMLSCIRCGLCLSVCPTYQQGFYEADSPRGRIAIARALAEGHLDLTSDLLLHWDSCILCDACSAICPSGVHMEHLGLSLRAAVTETKGSTAGFGIRAGMRWLLPNLAVLRFFATLARAYQKSALRPLVRASGLLKLLRLEEAEAMLPDIARPALVPQGQVWQARGPQRAAVSLLAGCVMSRCAGGQRRRLRRDDEGVRPDPGARSGLWGAGESFFGQGQGLL
jgi:glycolate oxidase iron-sulfur subunit